MKYSLGISNFLEEIASLFYSVVFRGKQHLCIVHLRRVSYLSLLFFGTLHSNEYIFPFLLCLSLLFLFYFFFWKLGCLLTRQKMVQCGLSSLKLVGQKTQEDFSLLNSCPTLKKLSHLPLLQTAWQVLPDIWHALSGILSGKRSGALTWLQCEHWDISPLSWAWR